jgi:hypothetical protein
MTTSFTRVLTSKRSELSARLITAPAVGRLIHTLVVDLHLHFIQSSSEKKSASPRAERFVRHVFKRRMHYLRVQEEFGFVDVVEELVMWLIYGASPCRSIHEFLSVFVTSFLQLS